MKYFQNTTQFYSEQPTAITLGKFDGVHRGHQRLIRRILEKKREGLAAAVFVIAPPDAPKILTSEEKKEKLSAMGVDCEIECPYRREILGMHPEEFVSEILVKQLKVRYLAVGTDFRFGYQRSGDPALLLRLGTKYGFEVEIVEKECCGDRVISSTYVRDAMKQGNMELVSGLLGCHYSVGGEVLHGQRLGRTIGMPTINLIPDSGKLLPPFGVYYSLVQEGDTIYRGITNIGKKPTVDGSFIGVETYLYDFSGDLYGRRVKVELLSYRRPEKKFASVDELKTTMQTDIAAGKEYFCE